MSQRFPTRQHPCRPSRAWISGLLASQGLAPLAISFRHSRAQNRQSQTHRRQLTTKGTHVIFVYRRLPDFKRIRKIFGRKLTLVLSQSANSAEIRSSQETRRRMSTVV